MSQFDGYDFGDIAQLQGDLETLLQRNVDVVVLNDAAPLVALAHRYLDYKWKGIKKFIQTDREAVERWLEWIESLVTRSEQDN